MAQNIDFDEEDAAQLQFPKVDFTLLRICRNFVGVPRDNNADELRSEGPS